MAGLIGFEQNQSGQNLLDDNGNPRPVGVWGDSDTDVGVLGTSGVIPAGEVDRPTRLPAGVYGRSWTDVPPQVERPNFASTGVLGEGMNDTDVGVIGIARRSAGVLAVGADAPGGVGDVRGSGIFCTAYNAVVALGGGVQPPGNVPPAGVVALCLGDGDGVSGDCGDGNGVHGHTSTGNAVLGEVEDPTSPNLPAGIGVKGVSPAGPGVVGFSRDNSGTAGLALGSGFGAYGLHFSTDDGVGTMGASLVGDGVSGFAVNGVGVRGESRRGLAGLFAGNVRVDRSLSVGGAIFKAGGGFEIDHPLDPENMVLRHSFVESPEMLNVYSGTVTTDGDGEATVELPDYFEALNDDVRYQVTVIGQFAQAIVAREIRDGRFTIATDRPKVKVCWQVTGVRHDDWADAHRIVVEQPKPKSADRDTQHPDRESSMVAMLPDGVREQVREALRTQLDRKDIDTVLARVREAVMPVRRDGARLGERMRAARELVAGLRAQLGGGSEKS
jgi:hypothetical protein